MYICPICGYDKLMDEPYDKDGNPSYEICFCCGFEFGYDDDSEGITFDIYRKDWIKQGAKWFDIKYKPEDWSIQEQLKNIKS